MKSKYLRLFVGVLISAVFIWLALRGLHLPDVWLSLRSADYVWLIPSIAVYFLAVWARTWRWDYLLRPIKQISLRRLFPVVVIGYMGNNVYPFRAGEVLRAVVLRQREGVSVSSSLATIIVERVFDGLVMLLFVFVALPFAPLPSDSIRFVVILGSWLLFGALLVFFAVAAVPARFLRLAEWFVGRFVPHRLRASLLDFAERFVEGLLCLLFIAVLGWALANGIIVSCACFGQDETPSAAKMAMSLIRAPFAASSCSRRFVMSLFL